LTCPWWIPTEKGHEKVHEYLVARLENQNEKQNGLPMIVNDDGGAETTARLVNWKRKKLVVNDGLLANVKKRNDVQRKSERLGRLSGIACAKRRRGRRRRKGRERKTH
jgi:hypothetical protein